LESIRIKTALKKNFSLHMIFSFSLQERIDLEDSEEEETVTMTSIEK